MNRRHLFTILLVCLLGAGGPCFALMMLDIVTKDKAKAMGLEVRVKPSGPDAVQVELEFEKKGVLQKFARMDLIIIGADGKHLSHSQLEPQKGKPGQVVVSFSAARASVDQFTMRIVAGDPGDFVGYDLRLKEFVDLKKIP